MCGIAGLITKNNRSNVLKELVIRMRDTLGHRGPDDVGIYIDNQIALAHTRLSIIDLTGGQQPLFNEDRTICLVINGEIYNYKTLQEKLISRGHHLATQSDCEVIIHLYEDEGENCVNYLEGMFAFALWDTCKRKLFLARDRLGIKPLYVAETTAGFCFASELTSIIHSKFVKMEVDPQALYAYMTLAYVPAPLSILKGVRKMLPAERLSIKDNTIKGDIFWTPEKMNVPQKKIEAIKELSERIENSVQSHLVSDVPVAAFLSGGVDSSGVVAMARKHMDIETFCVSFPDSGVDESPIARKVSEHLGTKHHEINIQLKPDQLIHDAVRFMDEPFADSSALPTYAVCQAARKVAKVVLSGDGGDEVFGGYTGRYRVAALKAALPAPATISGILRQLPPWRSGRRRSLPEMLDLASLSENERYVLERQITTASDRAALFGHQSQSKESWLRDIPAGPLETCPYQHPVHRALWADLMTSLGDDMLTKVDRMSMAHGLEVRVPLLDYQLIEFALSLPPHWLVSPWPVEGKRILRQVIQPLLPEGILDRPKQGFAVPLNRWLKDHFLEMFDMLCLDSRSYVNGFFEKEAVIRLRDKPLGEKPRHDLYALLVLELWCKRILG